jgi:hypothetical protein
MTSSAATGKAMLQEASPAALRRTDWIFRRRQAICEAILARIRRILVRDDVLSDAEQGQEWQPLAAMSALTVNQWGEAERLRDAFIAAIPPDLVERRAIRVQHARIISLLNQFLWVHKTPYTDQDSWPTLAQIEEDF